MCDSVHRGGGLPQCMLGYHPQTMHLPPPLDQVPPLGADTPRADTPHRETPPPPAQSMLGDTVNAQAVRILLECNLVECALTPN